MREIKFTTNYESTLSFSDRNFKEKYEERIGHNSAYKQVVNGETKHLAVCPRCDNPVVVLGIYKKISVAPHARHIRDIDISDIVKYNEYRLLRCAYYRKQADYVKEYVPETEEPQRRELYHLAKEHFDKAIYLLQKETGIFITKKMAEELAKNYAGCRVYNYIDATNFNIPWYLFYSFHGFPLHHMLIRKETVVHRHVKKIGVSLKSSKVKGYDYVEDNAGYVLLATNYRYRVDKNDSIREWLDFSIVQPDDTVTNALLYTSADRFSIQVDSYYFENLMRFENWKKNQALLDIAKECMGD